MTEEEKGRLGIEDRAADLAQDTKGGTIMRTNDTPNEGVITSYAQAPARTITAGGVTYAYRELGPKGGKDIDKVAGTTYFDILRATLTRSDPKEFLFFNRNATGKPAARAFVNRLKERTVDRDAPIKVKALQRQLKAIKKWGRGTPDDLSNITQPTLIANGDNDRMVPSTLSEDLHRRIEGSELIIYPDSGHGGIFQFHDRFAPVAVEFLGR